MSISHFMFFIDEQQYSLGYSFKYFINFKNWRDGKKKFVNLKHCYELSIEAREDSKLGEVNLHNIFNKIWFTVP